MGYQKDKVKIYDAKTGYNKLYKEYQKYHAKLDSWDNGLFEKFLPGSLNGLSVLDIGAGDGRIAKKFVGRGLKKYTACDIAEKLLERCKGWVQKVVCDLEQDLPFEDSSFDIVLAFFVLLHIGNIDNLFKEIYRILQPGGRFIVLHHIERRPFEYNIDSDKFKVINYIHRYENIEKLADYNFFDVDSEDLIEGGVLIGKIYCFTKK